MNNEMVIPLNAVLELVGDLCSNCQEKVRRKIAHSQMETDSNFAKSGLLQIVEDTAAEWRVSVDAIQAKSNAPGIVRIRREIAQKARRAGYSMPQIGKAIHRHHTTVIHLLRYTPKRYKHEHVGDREPG